MKPIRLLQATLLVFAAVACRKSGSMLPSAKTPDNIQHHERVDVITGTYIGISQLDGGTPFADTISVIRTASNSFMLRGVVFYRMSQQTQFPDSSFFYYSDTTIVYQPGWSYHKAVVAFQPDIDSIYYYRYYQSVGRSYYLSHTQTFRGRK